MDEGNHIADRMREFAEQLRADAAAIAEEDGASPSVRAVLSAVAALESDAEMFELDTAGAS